MRNDAWEPRCMEDSIVMHGHAKVGGNEREGHLKENRWCGVEREMGLISVKRG